MKIGLVSPSWPPDLSGNGITTFTKYMKLGLEACGHDTQIIAKTGFRDAENIHILSPGKTRQLYYSVLKKIKSRSDYQITEDNFVNTIKPLVKQNRIDVLIIEESFGWAHKIQKNIGIPVIVALHGPWHIIRRHLPKYDEMSEFDRWRIDAERRALDSCAAFFAPSSHVLSETIEFYGLQNKKNWILANPFMPSNMSMQDDKSQKPNRILFVGRYDHLKGGDLIIESFSNIQRSKGKIKLDFVGKDIGFEYSNTPFQRRSLNHIDLKKEAKINYQFHGLLCPTDIVQLRKKNPITVIASRFENYPYSLLEALSLGGLVIAPDVGGIREIIQDGQNGFLFERENSSHLTDMINKALSISKQSRNKISFNAKKTVIENNDPFKIANKLVEKIKKTL